MTEVATAGAKGTDGAWGMTLWCEHGVRGMNTGVAIALSACRGVLSVFGGEEGKNITML